MSTNTLLYVRKPAFHMRMHRNRIFDSSAGPSSTVNDFLHGVVYLPAMRVRLMAGDKLLDKSKTVIDEIKNFATPSGCLERIELSGRHLWMDEPEFYTAMSAGRQIFFRFPFASGVIFKACSSRFVVSFDFVRLRNVRGCFCMKSKEPAHCFKKACHRVEF